MGQDTAVGEAAEETAVTVTARRIIGDRSTGFLPVLLLGGTVSMGQR